MKILTALLFLFILSTVGCDNKPVDSVRYKINIPPDVSKSVRYYLNGRTKKRELFLTVSWAAFFDGEAIYVSSSRLRPKYFSSYPIAWSYVDSSLVLVYDNRYRNYVSDSLSLMKEIDNEMDRANILETNDVIVEDNLSLRFIRIGDIQTIDTSNLNVRICKQLGRSLIRRD